MFGLTGAQLLIAALLLSLTWFLIKILWSHQESSTPALPLRRSLTITVDIDAAADRVWKKVVDWERQGEWMFATSVWLAPGSVRHGVGAEIVAYTGPGAKRASASNLPLARIFGGFIDHMVIVQWEPPVRCEVLHVGKVVRGVGVFEVQPLSDRRARFIWSEVVELPFGYLGALGWPLIALGTRVAVKFSLNRLASTFKSNPA